MKVAYSCVVDAGSKFIQQACHLVLSLRAVGVHQDCIFVNLTPPARIHKDFFEKLGATVKYSSFFGDSKYCNKIAQLRNFSEDLDFVICCDTDVLFFENIEKDLEAHKEKVLGKHVDFANPPIDMLEELTHLVPELPVLKETLADIDKRPTYCGNFNGGLYIIPGKHLRALSAKWEEVALHLFNDKRTSKILGPYAWHLDQISFCFALNILKLDFIPLTIEYNYPLHFRIPKSLENKVGAIKILHYHDAVTENGLPVDKNVKKKAIRTQINNATESLRTLWIVEAEKNKEQSRQEARFSFVMGFHRSGTSAITSACEHLGYSIGNGPLLDAQIDNPKGYFENRNLVLLNEQILRRLESDWDDIFFSYNGRQQEICSHFSLPINNFLRKEFSLDGDQPYVLKDPRLMLTYGIWRSVMKRMNMTKPEIIFMFRNPLECAGSQAKRHETDFVGQGNPFHFFGRDPKETLLLWYTYNIRFLAALEDEKIIFVKYNDLVQRPKNVLSRLIDWSSHTVDSRHAETFAEIFLEKGLQHHHKTENELQEATKLFPQIADLYSQLDILCAKDRITRADIQKIVKYHRGPYAEIMRYAFMGRLYTVPKLQWMRLHSS